jgi:hypothetical protein
LDPGRTADEVGERGLPGTLGPDDRDETRVKRDGRDPQPRGVRYDDLADNFLVWRPAWSLGTDLHAEMRFEQGLLQPHEGERTPNPAEPILRWRSDAHNGMGIRAVEARLEAAVLHLDLVGTQGSATRPEFVVLRAGREDDVGHGLNLLTHQPKRPVVLKSGRSVGLATRDGDQTVLSRPRILLDDSGQLLTAQLELLRAEPEQGRLVALGRVVGPAERAELVRRAPILLTPVVERQFPQNPLDLLHMVRVVGREEEVDVDPALPLGLHVETELHVRKRE